MKHTLTLAAWNFRLARRYLLALWGIFAAQQLALVVFRICWQGAAGMGLASHYYVTMQIFAYLGFYLLTGLEAGLATHSSRRARSGYTWATLPGTPGQKFGAKAITIAAAEVVFAAWQFVWYIVEFYPVTALEVHRFATRIFLFGYQRHTVIGIHNHTPGIDAAHEEILFIGIAGESRYSERLVDRHPPYTLKIHLRPIV